VIIDTHCHVHPDQGGLGAKQDASEQAFLEELDASPIDRVVLLPIEPVIPTDFVFKVAAQRPGKISCYGSANPADGASCVPAFESLADQYPLCGLKLHPRRQGFSAKDFPAVKALVECAANRGLPTLIDCFPYGPGALKDDSLEMIEALSEALPKASLIIAHMGGIRILEALIVARTSYTIYLDLSLVYSVYRGSHIEDDIFYAIRRIGPNRCLYGSDYPDVGLSESYHAMREALDTRGFTAEDQEWIFGKTAETVLPFA
jgi:predicted TIM-barrel fold metal-dependent hydrolase